MSANSDIEWTDATWNPVRGCTKVSPGCKHCYAETFSERFRGVPRHPYEQGFDLRLVPAKVTEPLRWASPKIVFVNSMSDLFHEAVPEAYVEQVMRVMEIADWHTYQVLTKRAHRMRDLLRGRFAFAAHLSHVWWGVSVENRKHGLPRIDALRGTPAAVRFLSIEPLLEDLGHINLDGIHWVIVGGESGAGARPMEQAWVVNIREQCREANVPFFFKQWGGVRKAEAGRCLEGRTFDEMPARLSHPVAARQKKTALIEDVNSRVAEVIASGDCTGIVLGTVTGQGGARPPLPENQLQHGSITRRATADSPSAGGRNSVIPPIDAPGLSIETAPRGPTPQSLH
jgi:protein gp37